MQTSQINYETGSKARHRSKNNAVPSKYTSHLNSDTVEPMPKLVPILREHSSIAIHGALSDHPLDVIKRNIAVTKSYRLNNNETIN